MKLYWVTAVVLCSSCKSWCILLVHMHLWHKMIHLSYMNHSLEAGFQRILSNDPKASFESILFDQWTCIHCGLLPSSHYRPSRKIWQQMLLFCPISPCSSHSWPGLGKGGERSECKLLEEKRQGLLNCRPTIFLASLSGTSGEVQ